MALNLKTLATRSLSAAVFVVLLLGSVLWSYITFTLFFFTVAMIALNEFYKISEKLGAMPYKISGFIGAILLYAVFLNGYLIGEGTIFETLPYFKPIIALVPFFIFSVALLNKRPNPVNNSIYTISGILYAVLPFALMHQLVAAPGFLSTAYNPVVLLGVIFLIWSNDTFAYLGGSLMGKNKMIERISPGKTWEGTIFGVLVTFGISFLIRNYMDPKGNYWPLFGIVVPVMATIGDLVESMLKRQAGIKDSGSIMPGHGGALDRFDSLIFVTPFVVVFFYFIG